MIFGSAAMFQQRNHGACEPSGVKRTWAPALTRMVEEGQQVPLPFIQQLFPEHRLCPRHCPQVPGVQQQSRMTPSTSPLSDRSTFLSFSFCSQCNVFKIRSKCKILVKGTLVDVAKNKHCLRGAISKGRYHFFWFREILVVGCHRMRRERKGRLGFKC